MRLNDWPERLDNLLRAAQAQPFQWGRHDCVTFAADVCVAMTGADPLAGLRGKWRTERGAAKLLGERGGLRAAVCGVMGETIEPAFATTGDIALIDNGGREALAMCNGATVIGPGAEGLSVQAGATVLAVWGVR